MNALKDYLSQMSLIRRSAAGVKETSYYGTLETLFNEVGKSLKPKVRCVINLANKGAGIPDGGLFTPSQFQRSSNDLIEGQLPERGAIEVKGTSEEVDFTADSIQVAKYLNKYRQVLVTNCRNFLLITLDESSQPKKLERYSIADDEKSFWEKADGHRAITDIENERFVEFLKRVMLHRAPLAKPEDVAWFLASYARDAKARIEQSELSALATIRKALEESLGIKFDGEKGEHFFRSTLVQTLFYGIFSAWVLWHKRGMGVRTGSDSDWVLGSVRTGNDSDRVPEAFNWRTASWELRVPMITVLFEQISTASNLKQLNLVEVLDWTENVLNRVVREEFFARFAEEHAVQYFYEPFLQAFDPELRKALGVWYTPSEIVRYMVERVDRVLREELNLPDGLADESVYVLDPACGTGAYLVEVLKRINQTLTEKGEDSIRGQKLKKAVMSRVFGFEILPAPFVVSHLQIGLLLEQLGVGFSDDKKERAGVYLTNSLTGWDEHPKKKLPYPEFEDERDHADEVKRKKPILVILGNPPYNGFADIPIEEERELTDAYRISKAAPQPQGQGLNDLYTRFFRMAERRIAERSEKGIICYISNSSWLEDLSHPAMRERFLEAFDSIWIDNLNGDKYKTGKTTPDGKPDPSIFSTKWNREGIQVGTAVTLLVRNEDHKLTSSIRYRDFWGSKKLEDIAEATGKENDPPFIKFEPKLALALTFLPSDSNEDYFGWPLLPDLFLVSFPGVQTGRDSFLLSIDRETLVSRIEKYFDPKISHLEMKHIAPDAMKTTARFKAEETREYLLKRGFKPDGVVRQAYRPFDLRWLYWEGETKLLDEKRSDYFSQVFVGNICLAAVHHNRKDFDPPVTLSVLGSRHLVERGANLFPLYVKKERETLFDEADSVVPNLGQPALSYLDELSAEPSELFYHTVAILHSPEYAKENSDALRQNFPRIPLPANREDLLASAELGRRVAALLDTEREVAGVTAGSVRPELRTVGVAAHIGGKQFQDDDFKVTAGWGHGGKDGVTMPGKGKVERRGYSERELEAMADSIFTAKNPVAIAPGSDMREAAPTTPSPETGATPPQAGGEQDMTLDIYLNNHAYWRNVPEPVWNYYIGGYQVIKKWLSYREYALLGRPLTLDEITEITNMARRIAALILMETELNENYQQVKANTSDLNA